MMLDQAIHAWKHMRVSPDTGRAVQHLGIWLGIALLGALLARAPLSLCVALVFGGIGALLFLRYPSIGLYALAFSVPFGSLWERTVAGMALGPSELLLAGLLAAWALKMLAWRRPPRLASALIAGIVAYLASILVSWLPAQNLAPAIKETVKWLGVLLVCALIISEMRLGQLRMLMAALLLAGMLQGLLGIYQFLRQVGPPGFVLMGRYMRAHGTFQQPNPFGGYMGLLLPLAYGTALTGSRAVLHRLVPRRSRLVTLSEAKGLAHRKRRELDHSANTGGACTMLVSRTRKMGRNRQGHKESNLGALCGSCHAAGPQGTPPEGRDHSEQGCAQSVRSSQLPASRDMWALPYWLLATLSAAVMSAALVMSWSRGALLGLAAGALLVLLALGRRVWLALGALLLVLWLLGAAQIPALLPGSLVARMTDTLQYVGARDLAAIEITDANFAVVERAAHWMAAWRMFERSPWLGVGAGQYASVYPTVAWPRWQDPLGHAHNYWLNVLAEGGLLGLLGYASFVLIAFCVAWRAARQGGGWLRGVGLGALGMWGHLMAHSLFDNLYVHGMYLVVAMLLGAAVAVGREATRCPDLRASEANARKSESHEATC
jgi:hypothetical protein